MTNTTNYTPLVTLSCANAPLSVVILCKYSTSLVILCIYSTSLVRLCSAPLLLVILCMAPLLLVSLYLEDAGGTVSSTSGVTMAVHSSGELGELLLSLWSVHCLRYGSVCYLE